MNASPVALAPPDRHLTDPGGKRVVVIGAGLGGLAVAIRLLAAGLQVTVLEGEAAVGGRAGQIQDRGFTFDTGPSLITMPRLLDDLFALIGATADEHLHLSRLDPFYEIHWQGDPRTFLFSGDRAAMMAQIAHFSRRDASAYAGFMEASRRIYEHAIVAAGVRPFTHLTDFLALVPTMLRDGALRTVDGFVGRFFTDPQVRQAFGFHSLFIGGDPYRVPAVYAALAYLQIVEGVWYSRGGVYSLVRALAGAVRDLGGEIVCADPIVGITCDRGRATGVVARSGRTHGADVVISNADVVTTQSMLGRRRRGVSGRATMSCFLLYLGTTRRFPQLRHHTLLVGRDLQQFIREVTCLRKLPSTTSLYVHAPTRTDPSMAPPGCESITVLLPVPNLESGDDWSVIGDRVRDRVIDVLESPDGLGLSGLRASVVVEHRRTPVDFERRFGAWQGNAFASEPTLRQSAYFRQHNRDDRVAGLYYVGAGTHPGAGVPGVLLSAQVTASMICGDGMDWGRARRLRRTVSEVETVGEPRSSRTAAV